MIPSTGEEMLMMASRPAFATMHDIAAKIRIHVLLPIAGMILWKYSPHEERRLTDVLKHAMMKIAAMRNRPMEGKASPAAADNMSAPVDGLDMYACALYPMNASAE